jgi:hypothetical protein
VAQKVTAPVRGAAHAVSAPFRGAANSLTGPIKGISKGGGGKGRARRPPPRTRDPCGGCPCREYWVRKCAVSYIRTGCTMSGYGERSCTEQKVMKPTKVLVNECRECQHSEDYGAEIEIVK